MLRFIKNTCICQNYLTCGIKASWFISNLMPPKEQILCPSLSLSLATDSTSEVTNVIHKITQKENITLKKCLA